MTVFAKRKKVLLTNHHLEHYAGSELVTLDLAKEFQSRGWDVFVATFIYGGNMQKAFESEGISVFNILSDVLPEKEFDLVWGHHFPVLIKCFVEDQVRTRSLIISSLSSALPVEKVNALEDQADLILFNCYVNQERYILDNLSQQIKNKIHVLPNSVSNEYFLESEGYQKQRELKKVAVISNHPPSELRHATSQLKKQGLCIDLIGLCDTPRLITKTVLQSYDAVITIGRTVQHCFALKVPVFVYDHFGGPGWLNPDDFYMVERHNYSGKCCSRKISSEKIVQELIEGYSKSLESLDFFYKYASENYHLTRNVEQVLEKIKSTILRRENEGQHVSLIKSLFNLESARNWSRVYCDNLRLLQNLSLHSQQLQSELERTQAQVQQSKSLIKAMQDSKFWKLRTWWKTLRNRF